MPSTEYCRVTPDGTHDETLLRETIEEAREVARERVTTPDERAVILEYVETVYSTPI